MDGMYGFHSSTADYSMSPENLMIPAEYHGLFSSSSSGGERHHRHFPVYGSDDLISAASAVSEAASVTAVDVRRGSGRSDRQVVLDSSNEEDDGDGNAYGVIKAKIASHPSYPKLLDAFIDCQKVGAPPEMACLLDEIRRGNDVFKRNTVSSCFGSDPELDEFMETYCDVLVKYKSDLARPFDEATTFLSKIETQLSNLCKDHEAGGSSDEELSVGEAEVQEIQMTREERELKETLLRKFGGHISSLKHEFSKKKKKGKLPTEARQTLVEWWNLHDKWPYPTEADKISLAESTGLDQKQINNWFINQRKRHWKPSENMQLAVMGSLSGQFYCDD